MGRRGRVERDEATVLVVRGASAAGDDKRIDKLASVSGVRVADDLRGGARVVAPINVRDFDPTYVFRGRHSDGEVATRCVEVYDGDTIRVHLVLPVWHLADVWLRLRDQWSPELHQPGGPEARDYAAALVLGRPVWVRTYKRPSDDDESRSFVRLIADVGFAPDADGTLRDLAGEMIAARHASPARSSTRGDTR